MKRLIPHRLALLNSLAVFSMLAIHVNAQAQDEAASRAALRDPANVEAAEAAVDGVEEDVDIVVVEEDKDIEPPLAVRAEEMKRRAGEQIAGEPEGRANVLGMYVQEADSGNMRVVEVGAASPAFDAGIKKGDVILSFDGFKADSYRKWADGIRKIVTDSPEGDSMPVEIDRNGERINLRMRKPESNVTPRLDNPAPLGQAAQEQGQSIVPFYNQPNQPNVGYGGVDLLGSGFFGGNLDNGLGGTTQRAVAEIFRIGPNHPQPATGGTDERSTTSAAGTDATAVPQQQTDPPIPAATATGGARIGGRIGLAGFRNEQTGLLVMLDVGGLAPGTYAVSIDDPSNVAAQTSAANQRTGSGVVPTRAGARDVNVDGVGDGTNIPPVQIPPRVAPPGQPGEPPIPPPGRRPSPPRVPPSAEPPSGVPRNAPFGAPGGGASPQAPAAQPASPQGSTTNELIPQIILAQVSSDSAGSAATPAQTPATGSVQPPQTPATGAATPVGTPPLGGTPATGDANVPGTPARTTDAVNGTQDGNPRADGVSNTDAGLGTGVGTGSVGGLNQIGVLTIDQSGTGRLRTIVEGVQVADVLGMAIVISSNNPGIDSTFPQGENAARGTGFQPRIGGTRRPIAGVNTDSGGAAGTGGQNLNANPGANAVDGVPGTHGNFGNNAAVRTDSSIGGLNAPTPVAAGIIRVLGDRSTTASGQSAVQDSLR